MWQFYKPDLQRYRHEIYKFKVIYVYIVTFRPPWYRENISEKQKGKRGEVRLCHLSLLALCMEDFVETELLWGMSKQNLVCTQTGGDSANLLNGLSSGYPHRVREHLSPIMIPSCLSNPFQLRVCLSRCGQTSLFSHLHVRTGWDSLGVWVITGTSAMIGTSQFCSPVIRLSHWEADDSVRMVEEGPIY